MKPLLVCLFFAFLPGVLAAETWLHRQGPLRNGTVPWSSGYGERDWKLSKPLWTFSAGDGGSSPIVAGRFVYTLGWQDGKEILWCIDAATGKPKWNGTYACKPYGRFAVGDQSLYKGPASTPEYDRYSRQIFTLGIDGDLFCWSLDGDTVWHRNLYDQLGVKQRPKVTRTGHRDYGYTSSPVAAGPWCIVEAGSPEHGTVIAFNKSDGELAWQSECRDEAGHNNGPSPLLVDGVPCLAVLTLRHLVVMRLDRGHEGETVGTVPWATDYAQNIASAAVASPDVIVTSSYNQKKIARYRFALGKEPELVWEQKASSKICTPVIHKDHVYFASDTLVCLDFKTGAKRWTGGSFGDAGSVVATKDDRLIVWGGKGTLVLGESAVRSPGAYTPLASNRTMLRNDVWPHVVFVNGLLVLKDHRGGVACYRP